MGQLSEPGRQAACAVLPGLNADVSQEAAVSTVAAIATLNLRPVTGIALLLGFLENTDQSVLTVS
jgi:hypothetical protein